MSSMALKLLPSPVVLAAFAATSIIALATPSSAQFSGDRSSNMVAQQYGQMSTAIGRWEYLQANKKLGFADYAGFAMAYPDFPLMENIRSRAEEALGREAPSQIDMLRFFDAHPPLTNSGRARYALALAGAQRSEALSVAREAWRGGTMSGPSEAYMLGLFGSQFTPDDHRARMDALLWQSNTEAAARQIMNVPEADRNMAMARLALIRGATPSQAGINVPANALSDSGYLFNLVNFYRAKGRTSEAIQLLANRPQTSNPAFNGEEIVGDMLAVAKAASSYDTVRIASRIDDLFEPNEDISKGSFGLRDQYTDLMWMGGTNALWRLGDGATAAPLFERYGLAARTPLTRAKGFYWAGRASRQAGQQAQATRYFEMAAAYPHYYYGQLSLGALGRPMPSFAQLPAVQADEMTRAQFEERPVVRAIRHMAQNRRKWQTERRFFQAIGQEAKTPQELLLANELARSTGLEELAVVVGMEAGANGLSGYERVGFPIVNTPSVNDWTMTHAITRQESEFDQFRRSHAGARGMMQLMPGTAREQAGKMGLAYSPSGLFNDPSYNIRLGDAYFNRMLRYYDGSYPLAVAAYNAGPGNVNKWLRAHGDPRIGQVDWQVWIEKIKFTETRYYVMRVIGNAVSYSHMYPQQAGLPRTVDTFMR